CTTRPRRITRSHPSSWASWTARRFRSASKLEIPRIRPWSLRRQQTDGLIKEPEIMFITKMALPRRTFLRGMGVTLALPLLESMVPAMTATAATAANPLRRFGAIFVPLGERPGYWTPKTVGENFEFNTIIKPLERFRDRVTIVSELCDPLDGHATTVAAWLSGTIPKR